MDRAALGSRIKEARLAKKLTQTEVVGSFITRNMLSQIESGTATPSIKTLTYLAGVLELDPSRYAREKAGCIPFCWVAPQRRGQGLGIQLIGQAVAFYRPIGRNRLRLHCPAGNEAARRFFQKYGFTNVSGADSAGLLEKYIGYDQ